jgi:poly-gamma-glutamate capsule biosynthesis protein CapA/YwtB (metallophosphatase superfamily)
MGDKGVAATSATLDVWSALKPFASSGANKTALDQSHDIGYTTINGIKIGLVSFADFNNNRATPAYSVNIYHDEALVRKLVGEARQNADLVMVSMHWGTEDSSVVNADQKAQVDLLSSLGVDVVIGTGPHVLQDVELVNRSDGGKMVVWYSLGNMLSTQLNIDELIGGIAGFDVTKIDGEVAVENLTFIPTYMHYEWTMAEQASYDLLARKNIKLYLLKDSADPLSRSLLGTTVAAQQERVTRTLGPLVTVQNE